VTLHRVHALADAHFSGEMHDLVDALERPFHDVRIAHVADDHLRIGIERLRAGDVAVDLFVEIVEDADLGAAFQKRPREMTPDEATAPGDQNSFRHFSNLSSYALRSTSLLNRLLCPEISS